MATMPIVDSTAPGGSSGALCGSRDVGISHTPKPIAPSTSGTLIRKIEPHQKWASSAPLINGPKLPPAPAKLAQMAMAFGRSWAGKTLIRIDSVDGMMNAAPTPITARHRMRAVIDELNAANSEPMRKITRPSWSAPLRPNRSPSAPVVNSSPAKTSE